MRRVRKVFTIVAGFLLVAIGLVLSVPGIPGPGLAIVFVGLLMLGKHFHWARRTTHWLKQKYESAKNRTWRRKDHAEVPQTRAKMED